MDSQTPISGFSSTIQTQFTPRQPTDVIQADSATYQSNTVTLIWKAPKDTGCLPITNYLIQAQLSGTTWSTVGQSTSLSGVASLSTKKGQLTSF